FLRQNSRKRSILMRTFLTLFSIFFTAFQLLATSPTHAQFLKKHKVSLSVNNKPLGTAVKQLAAQSGVPFTYNKQQLDRYRVSVSFRSESLDKVLDKLLDGLPVTYKAINGKVAVYMDTNQAALSSLQERIEVKGSVTDS